jgi:SAM-dependent methyltransferase
MNLPKFNDPFDCINNKLPWDIDTPDVNLVNWFNNLTVKPVRVLELGCGRGINSVWLAQQGCQITAVDFHPSATETTLSYAQKNNVNIDVVQLDVLNSNLPTEKFDLIFDRGLFHGIRFQEKRLLANKISQSLSACGQWLSIIGSKETYGNIQGQAWFMSLFEIADTVEASLQITSVKSCYIQMVDGKKFPAWALLACNR